MSTNYYLHYPKCKLCKKTPERLHICHTAATSFTFQGHFDKHDEAWLVSWSDWKQYLAEQCADPDLASEMRAQIRTEYGALCSFKAFVDMVESTSVEARSARHNFMRYEYKPMLGLKPQLGRIAPGYDWLDAESFSFYGGEFH